MNAHSLGTLFGKPIKLVINTISKSMLLVIEHCRGCECQRGYSISETTVGISFHGRIKRENIQWVPVLGEKAKSKRNTQKKRFMYS